MTEHPRDKDQMLMNWPERLWICGPLRPFVLKRETDKWLRIAGRRPTEHALEIGCGLGKGAAILAEHMGFQRITAFDLEEPLIRHAQRLRPARLADRIRFFVGDAQDFPFPDTFFDAVVNFGIIHHVFDWRRCIREIARVLRPGGVFYFEEIYPPLYANFLMKHIVRHPTEDRFHGPQFLAALQENGLFLLPGVRTDSRFGIVGVAEKRLEAPH